jgi:signal transduction histidine kinase
LSGGRTFCPEFRTSESALPDRFSGATAATREYLLIASLARSLRWGSAGVTVTSSPTIDQGLRLDDIGAPLLVLDAAARMLEATPSAAVLIARFQLASELPAPLPIDLARELANTPFGVPITWRPRAELDAVLGCTRYPLGDGRRLLLMREITEQQRALSQRLHRQRLEETGRLAAVMAHDLRSPLSSIVYNVDLLHTRACELSPQTVRGLLHETQLAADQMRRTIAGLLDFVRLGPPVVATQSLREVVDRVSSLLRPVFRAGSHELRIELHDGDVRVRGNPLTIEQIFVNLLVNATEASDRPAHVRIASRHLPAGAHPQRTWRAEGDMVVVRVSDDGPGIAPDLAASVFEPFVTAKPNGTGLGLTIAREAAQSLGGQIMLEDVAVGCTMAVVLPIAWTGEMPE